MRRRVRGKKRRNKVLSLLLVAAMVLSMSMGVLAEEPADDANAPADTETVDINKPTEPVEPLKDEPSSVEDMDSAEKDDSTDEPAENGGNKKARSVAENDNQESSGNDVGQEDVKEASAIEVIKSGESSFYDSLATAFQNVSTDGTQTTVRLLQSVETSGQINMARGYGKELEHDIVLDLNGKKITYTGTSGSVFALNCNWSSPKYPALTITDSSAEQTGIITSKSSDPVIVNNDGVLTITGGQIENREGTDYSYAISSTNAIAISPAEGKKVSVTGNPALKIKASSYGKEEMPVINGGTFTSVGNNPALLVEPGNDLICTIKGGNFNALSEDNPAVSFSKDWGSATVKIEDGTFTGTVKDFESYKEEQKRIVVSGGKYSDTSVEDYLAAEYKLVEKDGKYVVSDAGEVADAVAEVNGAEYTTLQAAINAAGDGATVTLLKDVGEDIVVAADKNITLALGGYTLTNKDSHTITNNGHLKIVGNGTITHASAVVYNNCGFAPVIANAAGATLEMESGVTVLTDLADVSNISIVPVVTFGELVVNGATLQKTNGSRGGGIFARGGKVTVNSGTIKAAIQNAFCSGIMLEEDASLEMNGGSIKAFYPLEARDDSTGDAVINGGELQTTYTVDWSYGIDWGSSGTLTIGNKSDNTAGPSITGGTGIYADNGPIEISAGTITGGSSGAPALKIEDGVKVEVSGGTFSSEVKPEWCAEDYVPVVNDDNTYGVDTIKSITITVTPETPVYGEEVRLTADVEIASGAGTVTYAWYQKNADGIVTQAGTDKELVLPAGTAVGKYQYYCSITVGNVTKQSDTVEVNIARAQGAINIADGKEQYKKTYGDEPFKLEGITKTGDGTLSYEITEGSGVIELSGDEVTIKKAGTATITVTLSESENYAGATKTVIINVEQAEEPANTPKGEETAITVSDSTNNLSGVKLPDGWEWEEKETELIPGGTVTATAVYKAEDAKNYKTTEVEIQVSKMPEIVLDATDDTYIIGTDTKAVVKCTGVLDKFESVEVDGTVVDSSNYTLESGSTILTFSKEYMDTLAVGEHAVKLNYTVGSAETTILVKKAEGEKPGTGEKPGDGQTGGDKKPNGGTSDTKNNNTSQAVRTGDNAAVGMLVLLLLASAGTIGFIGVKRRYRNIR